MSDTFTRALARPPAASFAEGLTTADLGAPDLEKALAQHAAYCEALVGCGLELLHLPPDDRHPDSTFVEDTAVIARGAAIVTRPGAASRAGEVHAIRTALAGFFPGLDEIQAPGTVDGGDICEAGEHVFIGLSHRTNEEGAAQLARFLALQGLTSQNVDIRNVPGILHLKSGISYLGDGRMLVIEALAEHPAFSSLTVLRVPRGEEYAANAIRVNDRVLLPAGYPGVEELLRNAGDTLLTLDMSEFRKMDGGLSCLSLRF
ncbi:MAG: N(G),N(G)-dimethylarginine dimethylaminohydrolase [Acidobacteria bacterium]|nr:N(G),N(G)-dimethylarginine dimethylaminohydrolase [Acidobacteriota bacterium]